MNIKFFFVLLVVPSSLIASGQSMKDGSFFDRTVCLRGSARCCVSFMRFSTYSNCLVNGVGGCARQVDFSDRYIRLVTFSYCYDCERLYSQFFGYQRQVNRLELDNLSLKGDLALEKLKLENLEHKLKMELKLFEFKLKAERSSHLIDCFVSVVYGILFFEFFLWFASCYNKRRRKAKLLLN